MTQLAPGIVACPHCGTPVEGPEGTFCCHGCEAAAAILADAGLSGWYDDRQAPAPRVRPADDVAWDRVPVANEGEGACSATLQVDGLRCASCVWVTERVLERTPGVQRAQVSYATGRTIVQFDPDAVDVAGIASRIAALGYAPRPTGGIDTVDRDLLVRLGVATFSVLNVMGLAAALYAGWFEGMDPRFAQVFRWAALLVATPSVTYAAVPFFRGAWQSLKHGLLHMDLPIALAVSLLYAHGVISTARHEDAYLDSLTMLVALLLAGRVLEARSRKQTAEAAASLAAVVPRTARKVVGDAIEVVATDELVPGDLVDLGSGDEVGADGVVVQGTAWVRMAVLTGEAKPVQVAEGDRVVAGAVVDQGSVRLGVVRAGDRTLVQEMARQLEAAGAAPRAPSPADRLAPTFTAATLGVAAATALLVGMTSGMDAALARTVAVLVVACPCALALAGPLVGAAGLGALARRGVLLRSPDALEALSEVDTVVLDKTGTVTWGTPRVLAADVATLRIAAGLERFSRHPVAQAIVEAAVARGIPLPSATDVVETAGVGIEGIVDGRRWRVQSGGPDRVVVLGDDGSAGIVRLEDVPRTDAAADLAALRDRDVRIVLLTGDHADVAARVAADVGIDDVRAGVDPGGKVDAIRALQDAGHRVLFVGDGLNDGPALAAADVGVAMASGAASSVLAADGLLRGARLAPLAAALPVARSVGRRVRRNLVRSAIYNVAAVGAAVLGWVDPLVAAVLMPLSSGLVIASAAGVERAARQESP